MTVVADTSFLIDHLRHDERAHSLMQSTIDSGERVAASVLTKVELLAGMLPSEERETLRLFELLDWVAVDMALADRAGELANTYRRSHPGIDAVDFVIAATAERLNARVWTHNLKHFPMFPGLQRPY